MQTVAAADAPIVLCGTTANPTVKDGSLDQIAGLQPPTAAVGFNGQKATGLANGSNPTDAVAYGQLSSAAFTPRPPAGAAAAASVRMAGGA